MVKIVAQAKPLKLVSKYELVFEMRDTRLIKHRQHQDQLLTRDGKRP